MVERKSFTPVYGAFDLNEVNIHREAFGWTTINFDSNRVYMQRDTNILEYQKLLEFEKEYDNALEKFKYYDRKLKDKSFVEDIILLLYLVLVIPIIVFIVKKKIASKNRLLSLNTMLERVKIANSIKN